MKKYWKSLEELDAINSNKKIEPQVEFSIEGLTKDEVKQRFKTNRRDFLKMLGFTAAYGAAAASCQQPVRKAIPFLHKPEEIIPGVANHYATTFFDGQDYASLVIKVRDGRPIKVEGNEMSSITQGGTSARIQASVLGLYDTARLQHPLKAGKEISWENADKEIIKQLEDIAAREGKIVIISSSIISPSAKNLLNEFKAKYPTTEVVFVDAMSHSAMLEANKATFDLETIPEYHFDKAEIIVGFNADFLGNWISPIEYSADYIKGRDLTGGKKKMSKHYQFESYMSLTGSNADVRYPIKPSEEKAILLNLYNKIAAKSNIQTLKAPHSPVDVSDLANELLNHPSKSLIVSGTNDIQIQILVNGINFLLANLGVTLEFERQTLTKQGVDRKLNAAMGALKEGKVDAVILWNANLLYHCPHAEKMTGLLKKAKLSIAISSKNDETAKHLQYVLPMNHYLESWADAEPVTRKFSLGQPTINPLWNTRQAEENFMKWSGIEGNYRDYIQKYWESNIFPLQNEHSTFKAFWNASLQQGVFEAEASNFECPVFNFDYVAQNAADISKPDASEGIELVLYQKVGIGVGDYANNPWLQELPDPISKAVWDNYIAVSPNYAKEMGWKQEDVLTVDGKFELPVLIQPGQPKGTVSIALGYGRTDAGKIGNDIGQNASLLIAHKDKVRKYAGQSISLEKTSKTYPLATTQTHHSMEGREIVKETTLAEYMMDTKSGNESHFLFKEKFLDDKEENRLGITLYEKKDFPGAHWGLAIDFNKCTGCNACVVACQAENNIAVIGKEEVKNRRIMHWIRVDRYYSTEDGTLGSELVSENPEVFHQPLMCQHGDNAPCENVCPVAATPHSKEGLNSMAYNRCIGTRYCMNNCPYHVRRFNWYQYVDNDKFDYTFNDEYSKMVLNPDVVVRERGVVEKCSLCVQRIQEGKLIAKNEGRELRDGEIQPACAQACPTNAITFGDTNNENSKVLKLFKDDRSYGLLEELHVLPSVMYMTKVRNKDAQKSHGHEHGEHHS
jgi:molybdopterin-containing oxidoreductase family iron-sulfur binding subunit